MIDEELKEIIKQNQQTLESLDERVSKIQSKMRWQTVGNVIKTIFILGPVIIGIIYLSPYVKKYMKDLEPALQMLKLSPENSILNVVNPQSNDTEEAMGPSQMMDNFCDPAIRAQMVTQICK